MPTQPGHSRLQSRHSSPRLQGPTATLSWQNSNHWTKMGPSTTGSKLVPVTNLCLSWTISFWISTSFYRKWHLWSFISYLMDKNASTNTVFSKQNMVKTCQNQHLFGKLPSFRTAACSKRGPPGSRWSGVPHMGNPPSPDGERRDKHGASTLRPAPAIEASKPSGCMVKASDWGPQTWLADSL